MSGAKRQLEKTEQYRQIAYELLMQIGAIDSCGMHDFYYNTHNCSGNRLYTMVTSKLKNEYPDMTNFELFHKCVNEIMNNAADNADACPACQKLANE